ncbi:hypothetical protein ACGFYU_22215 [Streptomyces sp. NPDC048337]|uniref:hypothetical protein n=1 Tax=Streptomyces sp. NPDC048337 TaxID=3365535 RepID=UPI00370FDF03
MEPSIELSHAVLQRVGEFLKSLTPHELADLAGGKARLTLTTRQSRPGKPGGRDVLPDPDGVRLVLAGMNSREEGLAHLDELGLSRAALEKLARTLDVPVARSDRVDRLKERIVEATIGYRLRSGAIKGEVATDGGIGPRTPEPSAPSGTPEVPEGDGAAEAAVGAGSPVVHGEPGPAPADSLTEAGVEPADLEDVSVDPHPDPGGERVQSADHADGSGMKRLTR